MGDLRTNYRGGRSWKEWLERLVVDVALEESLSDRFHRATREKLSDLWLANFARNLPLTMRSARSSVSPRTR